MVQDNPAQKTPAPIAPAATRGRVLVAMSGGVDSSVTLYLLRQMGYDCVGATMRLAQEAASAGPAGGGPADVGPAGSSPVGSNPAVGGPVDVTVGTSDDIEDARSVAARVGVEHLVVDYADPFREFVVEPFVRAYEKGLTPNPCIECNRRLKFGALLDYALGHGFDYIATGHYARIARLPDGRLCLGRATDPGKDQSYVLYSLTQEQLGHVLLPLGTYTKDRIRAIAAREGFVNARKRDSQDICFVPDGDYLGFLLRMRGGEPYPQGDILTTDGAVVGRHHGIAGYTIGQRKGLGIALGHPAYVCKKDLATNTVTVGSADDLATRECLVGDWNWMYAPICGGQTARAMVKTRYRQEAQAATLHPLGPDTVRVVFDEPLAGIAPGQAAVAYDADLVMGGGTILG